MHDSGAIVIERWEMKSVSTQKRYIASTSRYIPGSNKACWVSEGDVGILYSTGRGAGPAQTEGIWLSIITNASTALDLTFL